jgi:hypothetical protein
MLEQSEKREELGKKGADRANSFASEAVAPVLVDTLTTLLDSRTHSLI